MCLYNPSKIYKRSPNPTEFYTSPALSLGRTEGDNIEALLGNLGRSNIEALLGNSEA